MSDDNEFLNPYHFIPVRKRDNHDHDLEKSKFETGELSHHSHDCYNEMAYSGRLICRLTTEDPIFIGAHEEESVTDSKAKKVAPFELEGRPAIPATTLRGMISSIAEAASNSAMRVLDTDRKLSFRRQMAESLSALGMVVKVGEELKLKPLVMPTLVGNMEKGYTFPNDGGNYSRMFTKPILKVYIDGYKEVRQRDGTKRLVKYGFINDDNPKSFKTDSPSYFYMKLKPGNLHFEGGTLAYDENLRFPSPKWDKRQNKLVDKKEYVLGIERDSDPSDKEAIGYTRGILRILGTADREDIPTNKKHEVFIPFPEEFAYLLEKLPPQEDLAKRGLFEIMPSAIERFHDLADERAASSDGAHPYELYGIERDSEKINKKEVRTLRLKHGDIVYFRPDKTGYKVSEVSFSSIWRGRVEKRSEEVATASTIGKFFAKIDKDLLPFNDDRKWISPAELLFGFVQADKQKHALAYKGKVRPSFGNLVDGQEKPYLPEVTLKILGSPKPPCPAMYFKRDNGKSYISKSGLSLETDSPQGRKYYLHRYRNDKEPWKSRNPNEFAKQKVRVTPLRPELKFYFHVDFDNLCEWELGLLCYAVRPNGKFRQKIGMGKSLGLGRVCIDPAGLFIIDRKRRYQSSEPFNSHRYHNSWVNTEIPLNEWPVMYKRESDSAGAGEIKSLFDLRDAFKSGMAKDIRNAIELLGNPDKVVHPVHTPQVNGADLEKETYKWFVANDAGSGSGKEKIQPKRNMLEPLDKDTVELPTLPRHEWRGK